MVNGARHLECQVPTTKTACLIHQKNEVELQTLKNENENYTLEESIKLLSQVGGWRRAGEP